METFVDASMHPNLALRKAEQKRLNNLKNMNLPWVFVEPTRLKSVKVPKARKSLNYYEGLDDDDLEFLGNSKIPLTKDDIRILRLSLHGEQISATDTAQDFNDTLDEAKHSRKKRLLIKDSKPHDFENNDLEKNDQNLKLDAIKEENEENIISSRSNGNAIDDLFASDDDKPKKLQDEEEQMEVEAETVKNIIMDAVKEREEASKWKKKKIESNRPITFYSYDVEKVTSEGQTVIKERITKGRRKLLSAISNSSSIKHEEDSITYAKSKFEKENALKRAALEKCFGAKHFKEYLEKQNSEIPQLLLNVK